MNRSNFTQLLKALQLSELKTNDQKGEEYCQHDNDALKNFKRNAERLGTDPIKVCALYLFKHIDWLETYIKTGEEGSEGLYSRIVDIRLYSALLYALVAEKGVVEDENSSSTD